MTTNTIYRCDTASDARQIVASQLFVSMRWMFWYELAATLRYVDITRSGIDRALLQLIAAGRVERRTAGDGRFIYRTVL